MATGDQTNMTARLRAAIPASWFPFPFVGRPSSLVVSGQLTGNNATITTDAGASIDITALTVPVAAATSTPLLDAVLAGIGWMLSQTFSVIQYVRLQSRVSTATDVFLDIAARDYTGTRFERRANESDASFRQRLLAYLPPGEATRQAVITRLTALTGNVPTVFEPTQPMDTGAYGYGGLGYGVAGGYGSMALPFQAFVTVKRPVSQGVPNLAGYSGNASAPPYAPGGYGVGLIAYSSISTAFSGVTDADIYQAVADTQPAGATVWTRIQA